MHPQRHIANPLGLLLSRFHRMATLSAPAAAMSALAVFLTLIAPDPAHAGGLYLVEATASIERGNAIDDQGGPGAVFEYIGKRFKPTALYGNPTRRQVFLIVDLPSDADMAELMFILTRTSGTEPKFTPLMSPELLGKAIMNARKAPIPQ